MSGVVAQAPAAEAITGDLAFPDPFDPAAPADDRPEGAQTERGQAVWERLRARYGDATVGRFDRVRQSLMKRRFYAENVQWATDRQLYDWYKERYDVSFRRAFHTVVIQNIIGFSLAGFVVAVIQQRVIAQISSAEKNLRDRGYATANGRLVSGSIEVLK